MSVEGADIYKAEMENGAAVGVQLPERNSDACFRLFKVFLDHSLDSAALEKTYTRVCRKKFSFADKYGNAYALAVVSVKFNYVYKPEDGKPVNLKALREHFYTNGFCVDCEIQAQRGQLARRQVPVYRRTPFPRHEQVERLRFETQNRPCLVGIV